MYLWFNGNCAQTFSWKRSVYKFRIQFQRERRLFFERFYLKFSVSTEKGDKQRTKCAIFSSIRKGNWQTFWKRQKNVFSEQFICPRDFVGNKQYARIENSMWFKMFRGTCSGAKGFFVLALAQCYKIFYFFLFCCDGLVVTGTEKRNNWNFL